MQRVFMLSVSVAVVIWAASAVADSPNLKGDYGFTRTVRCIVSDTGFNDKFRAEPDYFGEAFAEEGVRTFNGDGNGTQSFTGLNIEIPSGEAGANGFHVTDQKFRYIIDGDGKWSVPGGGSISGFIDTGPRKGQTFTITNIAPAVGHISTNAATLTLSTVGTPVIETITHYDPTTSPPTPLDSLFRICNRSNVLISLPPGQ
jgi:hypothetical protein